jgi:hypothetical protein
VKPGRNPKMKNSVTLSEFRNLLVYLRDHPDAFSIQFRHAEKGWQQHFMTVLVVTGLGAIFIDDLIDEFINISNISQIAEFKLNDQYSHKGTTPVQLVLNEPIRVG